MAVKIKEVFVCRQCGYESPKWNGKCPNCGQWNTFEQQIINKQQPASAFGIAKNFAGEECKLLSLAEIDINSEIRYDTGLKELNRVLGGGIVKGSLVLLGGDPGIGKSTLLLQICQFLGEDHTVLYVSGEESARQIKLRAARLNVTCENLTVVSQTDVDSIVHIIMTQKPDIVMIDSIQTMNVAAINSSSGSVTQVRESTNAFMHVAKSEDIPIIVVGHVNKDGAIAGPKVLEHAVDAVLYFEGDRNMPYRILRAVKNRFGSTNEIGVFDMQKNGLVEVENPSEMLLAGRPGNVSGICVACVMEGSRPILAEVQSLVTKTGFGNPRRMSTGFDYNRLYLIIAVLEKRSGFFFGNLDSYINVVGGLKLDEPAADLPIALALVSGVMDNPISSDTLAFGELGLGGEIRSVTNVNLRIKEAQRLGFKRCILPKSSVKAVERPDLLDIELIEVSDIRQAVAAMSAKPAKDQ